jgi:microsomal dipeptidase-like Zn-dependent dipeptidase
MSDEEARIIARSGGLVGIVFHGGRLPGGIAKDQLNEAKWSRSNDKMRDAAMKLIMSNILQFIKVAGNREAWDCICLGTDMDGVIEPLRPYNNYTNLWNFSQHLVQFFHRPFDLPEIGLSSQEVKNIMYDYEPEKLAEKIIHQNVLDFLKKYFNDDYLGGEKLLA